MRAPALALLALLATSVAAPARAGTIDAPELADPAGDCANPAMNEYLDIVAAWISDETEAAFNVNLAIAKWNEAAGEASGFSVQFSHQGVAWGVIVAYSSPFFGGWTYSTGQADEDSVSGFNETSGSFTPGTPAVITASFPKALFPHNDPSDNRLVDFNAFSADLKTYLPFAIAEGEGAPIDSNGRWVLCDEAVGDGTYEFRSGAHATPADAPPATGGAPAANATGDAMQGAAGGAGASEAPAGEGARKLPLPTFAAAAAGLAVAALARRGRR